MMLLKIRKIPMSKLLSPPPSPKASIENKSKYLRKSNLYIAANYIFSMFANAY